MDFAKTFIHHPDSSLEPQAGEPWGSEQVVIHFAGNAYKFLGLSQIQATAVRERFGELCLKEQAECSVPLEIQIFRVTADQLPSLAQWPWEFDVDIRYTAQALRLLGRRFLGRLDWSPTLNAALWTTENETLVSYSVFENFFRIVVAYDLLERGGVLLHSAAVVDGNAACVFFGQSGAGKSTISRLSLQTGRAVLSDDLNALHLTKAAVMLEKIPFAGDLGQTATASRCYPVRGLYLLKKASTPALRNLSPAAALATLISCAPFVNRNPFKQDLLFDNLQAITTRLPVHTLDFRLDSDFWNLLR